MLKHEDNPQLSPQPAAKVRVTPEELAAAVTALQIRKEGQPGTIAIGEAVEELELDVTPEEVLAEIQSGRIKKRYFVSKPPKLRFRVLLATLMGLVSLSVWGVYERIAGSPSYDVSTVPTTSYSPTFSVNPPPVHLTYSLSLVVADASGKMVMLSEVGNNQPVTCTLNGNSLQQAGNGPVRWTVIKHDGKVYLRGWMARTSAIVLEKDGADVSALPSSISVPVTLPVDGFNFTEEPQDFPGTDFHASNIHLDGHAYEKW